jgi:hypothetical protein
MALISPGVEVSIVDESQYIPAATNSVPYILLATAQNKVSGTGVGVAAGTLAANANKTYLISSQRDLSATFGVPFFYKTTTGTPINGYELNEYGLLAAYSALGVSNRCYVQRVDIDLAELTATLTRPTGEPANGTYWLDTASTLWGIFEWNQTTAQFTNKIPTVITDTADLETGTTVPLQSIGSIGDYAVVASSVENPGYYKRGGPTSTQTSSTEISSLYNTWVLVGSDEWKTAWPTVQGTLAPTTLTANSTLEINGNELLVPAFPNNNVTGLATLINTTGIEGVFAANIGGKLFLYADSTATADGSTGGEGIIAIGNGPTPVGNLMTALGITTGEYLAPAFQSSYSYEVPRWRTTDTTPEPTGSVWQKDSNVNLGTNIVMKKYNATLGVFVQVPVPIYINDYYAIYGLDPSGGGANIPLNTLYARTAGTAGTSAGYTVYDRYATGPTVITGVTTSPGPFISGNAFTIRASTLGSVNTNLGTATISGTTASDFVAAVSAAAVPYVSASINSAGAIVFTHSLGGDIVLTNTIGTPIATAGINTTIRGVRNDVTGSRLVLSNWTSDPFFTYTASDTAPDQDPDNGRLWYYSATDQVDIMIQNNGSWLGYQNVTNDVRGDNLERYKCRWSNSKCHSTNYTNDDSAQSPLVYGDLWIDTSDLENYPLLYRWTNVNGEDQWVTIDNTDQTTENGILFADARWAPNGTTDPITDAFQQLQVC